MSENRNKNQLRIRWPEWLLPAFFLPSWLMSLGFHMILFVAVALIFQRTGVSDGTGESDRVVDIFVKDSEQDSDSEQPEKNSQDANENHQETQQDENSELLQDEDLVQNLLDAPEPLDALIGAGSPGDVLDLPTTERVRQAPQRPSAGASGSPPGETRFWGIKDSGTRFVYIIDCSGSMHSHKAINVAKAELKKSLSLLESTQQFQVIFYNDNAYPWHRRGRKQDVYFATDTDKRMVSSFIDEISPSGGTEHLPALIMGLNLNPEVMYFLTDADYTSRMSNAELERIKKRNGGRTRIHCVEFGVGPQLPELAKTSFLKALANSNSGNYRYRDVKKF